MKVARLALLSLVACSGTDTGNPPVIDFKASACHDQSYKADKGVLLQSLDEATLTPDARFKGLTCIEYEQRAPSLHFLVSNYMSGCGSENGWTPHVERRADGGIDLIIEDTDCSTAKCGWCLYDLSFDVELEPGAGDVHVYQRGCQPDDRMEITAPIALTQTSDIKCDYTSDNALAWKGRGDSGERMLCGGWGFGLVDPVDCDQGLTCTKLGSDANTPMSGGRCMRDCRTDVDCDALSACVEGVCQLKTTGLRSVAN